ncbi:cupin domain-containing protein [Pseudomonas panipatensis]|uniref:Cupin domain-containing protein n=1 Tax=Pseudomonas panipatensis TaxID=428992 RepID=A0A1G8BI62_9PSED|nr:cupin domain-containing protein [Pseudomonas panipatensis]SDH32916.1 Cupin domain-containing protein [Pseudomonas panipatensis]SMP71145.1 Cupin domain-containing protein [Pseudomonas panipatensis]
MQALPAFKRVVTGHDAQGQALVASCGPTPHNFPLKAVPGTLFYEVWNSTGSPALLDNAGDPTAKPLQLSPAALGSLIRVVDIPPDSVQNQVSAEDAAACFAEIGESHAGTGKADSKHKLMHRTETLDYGIVTEGEVWLVLDGEEVHLRRGDIVVQRGTNHAWSNRTEQMARMVFILLDGRYAEELREVLA